MFVVYAETVDTFYASGVMGCNKAIISLNIGSPPEAELFPEKIFFIFPQLFRTEKYLKDKKYFCENRSIFAQISNGLIFFS